MVHKSASRFQSHLLARAKLAQASESCAIVVFCILAAAELGANAADQVRTPCQVPSPAATSPSPSDRVAQLGATQSHLGKRGAALSSRGPRLANKLLHTYTPPYSFFIFHLLPLFVFIIFLHSFLSISSVFLSSFFQNVRHPFLLPPPSFTSPTTLQNVISSISSPHPFHFFAKYIAKNICHQKIFDLSKNDLSISWTKNRTATTSLPSFVSSLLSSLLISK